MPESPALGGYGYDIDGRLFNEDTLKFYEVLIGMERGGVLAPLKSADRPVVCEVGPGWAGFAYQFKTLFPRATYVLVDFPELFLFSATYLAAVFPDARLHWVTEPTPAALEGWRDADFVFVPNTSTHLLEALPLDLMVNMVSFQEMTDAQVRGYADIGARAGCPALYSLNRERSPYNTELVSVREALAEHYTLTEVPVLDTDYTSATRKPPKPGKAVERTELNYRHLVGRLTMPMTPRARSGDAGAAPRWYGPRAPRVVLGMTLLQQRQAPARGDRVTAGAAVPGVLAGAPGRRLDRRHRGDRAPLRRARPPRALRAPPAAARDDRHLARGGRASTRRLPHGGVFRLGQRSRPLASSLAGPPGGGAGRALRRR